MVAVSILTTSLALQMLLATGSLAHPGEQHDHAKLRRDISFRDMHAAHGARALAQCSNSNVARDVKKRSVQRRADKVRALREARGLSTTAGSTPQKFRRDLAALEKWEEVSHNGTGIYDYDAFSAIETVFDANTSCILAPEVTAGPYYVVGEYFRSNVKEAEYSEGLDLFLEVQYVDISTCEPVPAVAVDIWNANATGVVSSLLAF